MQCHYSFLIVFALLLLLKVSSIECQPHGLPYSITKTERDVNQLTLQCTGTLGSIVSNAVFYRNGVLNTSDECFNSSMSVATTNLGSLYLPNVMDIICVVLGMAVVKFYQNLLQFMVSL